MRPVWDRLERPGSAARVWQASLRRFVSNVLGPHFEQVCRDWALHHADPDLLGGLPARVGHGVVHDPKARTGHEVDVAVVGIADGHAKPPLPAIGEAKWDDTMGVAHIERLKHIRELIAQAGRYDTTRARLLCFSGAGFSDKAHAAAATSPDIHLIDLPRLYGQA
ncbi:restriction endonuclease [Streptomyces sp. 15-116A]|nr:restriction endonuclease [Streptomyces sp. 15-116A]